MAPELGRGDDPLGLIEGLFSGPTAGELFGEPVSVGMHMRQTALLAESAVAEPSLVVAALLHDVAYVIGPDLTDASTIEVDHAPLGAAWLARWFPPSVTEPVRLHVDAKRYLSLVEPRYAIGLSRESARTLALQGGVMTAAQAKAFEAEHHFETAIQLRRFDELAKEPATTAPPIEHFWDFLRVAAAGRR